MISRRAGIVHESSVIDLPLSIEWGAATLPLPGEAESGDRFIVRAFEQGVLLAVVDGVGHGDEAVAASRIAIDTLRAHADEPPVSLVMRCHDRLRRTRGVVMTLASINARQETATWLGIGNVESVLIRAGTHANPLNERVMNQGGVIGYNLPRLNPSVTQLSPGDTFIFLTDGVTEGFVVDVSASEPPRTAAQRICTSHAKGTDDALVLVARYKGKK